MSIILQWQQVLASQVSPILIKLWIVKAAGDNKIVAVDGEITNWLVEWIQKDATLALHYLLFQGTLVLEKMPTFWDIMWIQEKLGVLLTEYG